jgi:hypothetical protein
MYFVSKRPTATTAEYTNNVLKEKPEYLWPYELFTSITRQITPSERDLWKKSTSSAREIYFMAKWAPTKIEHKH